MTWVEEISDIARKAARWLDLTDEDLAVLKANGEILLRASDRMVDAILNAILSDEFLVERVKEAGLTVEKARELLRSVVELSISGGYDEEHAKRVAIIGLAHARRGIPRFSMVLAAGVALSTILGALAEEGALTGPLAAAICKSVAWHLCVMLESYEIAEAVAVEKAAGISKGLYRRLVRVGAEEAYKTLKPS